MVLSLSGYMFLVGISSRKMTATRSASERALKYVRRAPRLTIGDLRDNPGARTRVSIRLI